MSIELRGSMEADIADHLKSGPKSAAALARETNTNEGALYRILRALSSVGVFTQRGQRLGHTFQDSQVVGACEKVNILDHHPVAVQKNSAFHGGVTDQAADLKGRAR